jgi:hypothetical protein
MVKFVLLFSCLSLSLATYAQVSRSPHSSTSEILSSKTVYSPAVGDERTIYSGDTMVGRAQLISMRNYFIKVKQTYSDKCCFGATEQVLEGSKLTFTGDTWNKKQKVYVSDTPTFLHSNGSKLEYPVYFKNKKKGVEIGLVAGQNFAKLEVLSQQEFDTNFVSEFEDSQRLIKERQIQTIEYVGKSGEILTFLYLEYAATSKETLAKPAFTREFTVDLSETNLGGFKGAIFEVVDASQFEITYKFKQHFKI